ncbi:MAG: SDR family oxidoreductase [Planctomycetota bacterium]
MTVLEGKTALVTGGARRIGAAIASALCQAGMEVIIHYHRSQDEAEALADKLIADGGHAQTLRADLGDPAAVEALLPQAKDQVGPIHTLINNASIFDPSHLLEFCPTELQANMQIHAMAPLQLARALQAQNQEGNIINLLDTRIHSYDRLHAAYHLSKRALLSLTKMLALELAPRVRVNAVAPGLILPPEGQDDAYLTDRHTTNPLHTHGSAKDIAEAVLYLLRAPFITGEILHIDGGRHLHDRVYE